MATSQHTIECTVVDPFRALDDVGVNCERITTLLAVAHETAEDIASGEDGDEDTLRSLGGRIRDLLAVAKLLLGAAEEQCHAAESTFYRAGVHRMPFPGRA